MISPPDHFHSNIEKEREREKDIVHIYIYIVHWFRFWNLFSHSPVEIRGFA